MTPSPKHIDTARQLAPSICEADIEDIATALDQIESDALERAAKECDSQSEVHVTVWGSHRIATHTADVIVDLAARIRAMKAEP